MRVFRIVVLLLIAASMNYVVGFAIAYWSPLEVAESTTAIPTLNYRAARFPPKSEEDWPTRPPQTFDLIPSGEQVDFDWSRRDSEYYHLGDPLARKQYISLGSETTIVSGPIYVGRLCTGWYDAFSLETVNVGFPVRSLRGEVHTWGRVGQGWLTSSPFRQEIRDGVELEPSRNDFARWSASFMYYGAGGVLTRIYPLRPIAAGFIANTTVYFAILVLIGRRISALVHWRRARAGLCRFCRYDVVGLETCPECGGSVVKAEN